MNYYTSDCHFGHRNILKFRPEFSSIEEHDNIIFDQISKLNKKDILFILGDFIFDCENYDYYINTLNKMSCRFKVIFGNHDTLKLLNEPKFEIQLPLFSHKNIWLSHAPIHSKELSFKRGNLHGHLHKYKLDDVRYLNVNLDVNNYKFISFDEFIEFKNNLEVHWS